MIDNQKFWTEKYLVLVPIVIDTLIVINREAWRLCKIIPYNLKIDDTYLIC